MLNKERICQECTFNPPIKLSLHELTNLFEMMGFIDEDSAACYHSDDDGYIYKLCVCRQIEEVD